MQPQTHLMTPIAIRAYGSISPLGNTLADVRSAYAQPHTALQWVNTGEKGHWEGALSADSLAQLARIRAENPLYQPLDPTVLMAIYSARIAVQQARWPDSMKVGINVGASRGATQQWEKYYKAMLEGEKMAVVASPVTTLGNVSSWLAYDLAVEGPQFSHSITCSTAMHAFLNGIAWLQAGMADAFIVGGSEAPLTPFTLAQMQALKLYTKAAAHETFPCRALDPQLNRNSFVLGEGAALFAIDRQCDSQALGWIIGWGYATEKVTHGASISADALCFQRSMRQALEVAQRSSVDAIVMHAPGTVLGDQAERNAIEAVFGAKKPYCTSNKWKIGHTLGASGALSVELALQLFENADVGKIPYLEKSQTPDKIETVMVNAVGFGGNAVSLIIQKPKG